MTPDFLIIGAAKSGTSTLYDDLRDHPDLFMPDNKEPDILEIARDDDDARALYSRHFAGAGSAQLRGEGSTFYTMLPDRKDVAAAAHRICGADAKLIYIIRDPVERIVSHLAHDVAVGRLRHDEARNAILSETRFVAWSDYPRQIEAWLSYFDAKNILLIRFEHYVSRRAEAVAEVARFLGVDAARLPQRVSASNQRGSQFDLRSGWSRKLAQSRLYRFRLRALIPHFLRQMAKRALSRRQDVSNIAIDKATRDHLTNLFRNQEEQIAVLPVKKLGF